MDIIYSYNLHWLALTCLLLRMLMIHITVVFNQFVHFPRNWCLKSRTFLVSRTYFFKIEIARVVKYIKMVNYNDGENEIFVISKKFEEIQGEIFRNQSAESPITLAKTNLAPEVCHFLIPGKPTQHFRYQLGRMKLFIKWYLPNDQTRQQFLFLITRLVLKLSKSNRSYRLYHIGYSYLAQCAPNAYHKVPGEWHAQWVWKRNKATAIVAW